MSRYVGRMTDYCSRLATAVTLVTLGGKKTDDKENIMTRENCGEDSVHFRHQDHHRLPSLSFSRDRIKPQCH